MCQCWATIVEGVTHNFKQGQVHGIVPWGLAVILNPVSTSAASLRLAACCKPHDEGPSAALLVILCWTSMAVRMGPLHHT